MDTATFEEVIGWAYDHAEPGRAVTVSIGVDGHETMRVVANVHRRDLELAGIGTGRHSFRIAMADLGHPPPGTSISAQFDSGEHLTGSPLQLTASFETDPKAREAIRALINSPATADVLRGRVLFIASQMEHLLTRMADRHSNRTERAAARAHKWRLDKAGDKSRAGPSRQALIIDESMPAPGRDAGSQAVLSHMQALVRLGFEVTFAAADMAGTPDALAAHGIATLCAPWVGSVEEVLRRQAGEWDLIYMHRVGIAARYKALARYHAPKGRLLYSLADLHSLRLLRQAAAEDRPELIAHAKYIRSLELAAAAECDAVITHSPDEAELLRGWLPHVNVHVVPWAATIAPTPAPFRDRDGVLFVGSFAHAPNLDAAIWLMDEIMPLVWEMAPFIHCIVVGAGTPDALIRRRQPRVEVMGEIPDLQGIMNRVRLSVAPLAFGAGLKGKVLDSLAGGLPCVCTPIAAEGFRLPASLSGLIATDAAGLARSIVRLHGDPALFQACRDGGLDLVRREFSDAAVDSALRAAVGLPQSTPSATTTESVNFR